MTGFKREIRVIPGYDHRDEPGGRGADGCDLVLTLTGDLGAIVARVDTGWMTRPLAGDLIRGAVQQRRPKPGIDANLVGCYPSGGGMYAHSPVQHDGFESESDECPYLDGKPCWCYGVLGGADGVLERLVSGGSDAAFELMAEFYQSWLVERAVSAT